MGNFHIGRNGEPKSCSARPGGCPLGGEHFDNEKDAWAASEKIMAEDMEIHTTFSKSINYHQEEQRKLAEKHSWDRLYESKIKMNKDKEYMETIEKRAEIWREKHPVKTSGLAIALGVAQGAKEIGLSGAVYSAIRSVGNIRLARMMDLIGTPGARNWKQVKSLL